MKPLKPSTAPLWQNPACRTLEYQIVGPGEAPDPRNWKLIGVDSRWREHIADSAWCIFNLQGDWSGSLPVQIGRFLMAASPTRIIEEAGDVQNTLCRPTADAAEFLFRYYPRHWSSKSYRPVEWLKSCKPEWLRNQAANVQLVLATPTADKLQQILVGYVSRPEEVL